MYTLIEIALTVGVLTTLVTVLAACVCGCKNSNQKSELVGTAGVVKIRFDEEAPSPTPTTPASIKRASTQNSHRSLPEIPHQVGRHDSGDTASEIYATVNIDEGSKALVTASTSRDHPYEHAYAKLQKESHVTVEITPDDAAPSDLPIDEREVNQSGSESVVISASVAISGQLPSSQELPYITPPAHPEHAQQHFSGDSTDSAKGYTSISVREPLSNIRAQSTKVQPQPHYATVSDDSDEMYAAISEGGSDTYAQIAPSRMRRSLEVATRNTTTADVTDASNMASGTRRSAPPEMGVTTNATHSRQASSSSCGGSGQVGSSSAVGSSGAVTSSPKPERRPANSPLPPPPAPSAHPSHHRISSAGDLHFGHDKLRRSFNEKHERNNSCVSSSDFYGCNYPVEKHRFSYGDLVRGLVPKEVTVDIDTKDETTDNLYNSIDGPGCSDYSSADANTSINSEHRITESPSRNLDDMYAKVMKKKGKADEPKRKSKDMEDSEGNKKFRGDDPGYETIDRKKSINHGYETIAHKERTNSQSQDPGYETVKDVNKTNNDIYANNNLLRKLNHLASANESGPNSMISSDPGYEHISKMDNSASDSDPNYEVLRNQPPTPPYATIAPNFNTQPTYSTVNKKSNWPANNNDEALVEPNYESMPNEPLYTTGSESDPNYESVRPKDPNYDSVSALEPNYESLRLKDPKYESVRSKSSKSSKDPNYESVKYFELSKKDPPYDKVQADSSSVHRSDSAAGYERINVANRDTKNSINGTDATVSDYFQV